VKPNNFPREGMHSPVTQQAVKRLENERPVLNPERHYTIGGAAEATVHSSLYAEREAAITNGSRRLNHASDKVRTQFAAHKSDARTEYIRAQREAASAPARGRNRTPTHSR